MIKPIPFYVRLVHWTLRLIVLMLYTCALFTVMNFTSYMHLIFAVIVLDCAIQCQHYYNTIDDSMHFFKKHGWPEGGESLWSFIKNSLFKKD